MEYRCPRNRISRAGVQVVERYRETLNETETPVQSHRKPLISLSF
jgi:hypothetical protein